MLSGLHLTLLERAEALFEAGADAIVIDTASMVILQVFFVKSSEIRAHFPDRTLIAGNITAEGARASRGGADVVKVGQPGSICANFV